MPACVASVHGSAHACRQRRASVMVAGLALFALALLDELVTLLRGEIPAYQRAEAEKGGSDGH